MKGDGSSTHPEAKEAELLPELRLKDWFVIKCKQLEEWRWEEVLVLLADASCVNDDVINDINKWIKPNVKSLKGILACGR
ncbi:hypothetical protein EDC04DRAFT_2890823 [Pisolithus marmoratus]|nr:hypothetical protein EDC04DRAFT_2890823 [Pisolithus marmoratus]